MQSTPTPWDTITIQDQAVRDTARSPSNERGHSREDLSRILGRQGSDRDMGSISQHARNNSGTTGFASSGDYSEAQNGPSRRHDYDVHAMEASLSSPRGQIKSPIPAPTVTVRSEFPTLSRSKHQQSLTCLVTVEVVEGKWRPNPDDLRGVPPLASPHGGSSNGDSFSVRSPKRRQPLESINETNATLVHLTRELHARVDNWHGLDFAR